jgi:hypothetical protein
MTGSFQSDRTDQNCSQIDEQASIFLDQREGLVNETLAEPPDDSP